MSGLVGGGEGVMYSNVQLSDGYTRLVKTGLGRSTVDNLFCNFLAGNNESLFFFLATGKKSRAEQSTVILGTRRTTLDRNV